MWGYGSWPYFDSYIIQFLAYVGVATRQLHQLSFHPHTESLGKGLENHLLRLIFCLPIHLGKRWVGELLIMVFTKLVAVC